MCLRGSCACLPFCIYCVCSVCTLCVPLWVYVSIVPVFVCMLGVFKLVYGCFCLYALCSFVYNVSVLPQQSSSSSLPPAVSPQALSHQQPPSSSLFLAASLQQVCWCLCVCVFTLCGLFCIKHGLCLYTICVFKGTGLCTALVCVHFVFLSVYIVCVLCLYTMTVSSLAAPFP